MKKISFVLIMATVFSIVTTGCKAQLFAAKLGAENEATSIKAKEAANTKKAALK